MARARIAVVGAGLIGRRHIEVIQKSQSAELAAIADPSPQAADIAKRAGVVLYTSLAEMLARERPDGVILATPNQLHVEQALQCVACQIPVLVEKPIGHTLEAATHLVAVAEQAHAKLLVGHHRTYSTIVRTALEIVKSGSLGRIVGVIGSAAFYKPDRDGYFDGPNAWRKEPGGGPILINMIHEVGILRALIGEIIAVQAFSSNATRGFNVEDTVAINMRFAGGALGTFLLSDTAASAKNWEHTSQENKAYPTYADEDAYTILGVNGSLGVPTMRLKYYTTNDSRSWWNPFTAETIQIERDDPLARQIEHFAAVIRGDALPLVSGRDGLQNLRVTAAIADAARIGAVVHVATN
jgi:predicted dehydrogenase